MMTATPPANRPRRCNSLMCPPQRKQASRTNTHTTRAAPERTHKGQINGYSHVEATLRETGRRLWESSLRSTSSFDFPRMLRFPDGSMTPSSGGSRPMSARTNNSKSANGTPSMQRKKKRIPRKAATRKPKDEPVEDTADSLEGSRILTNSVRIENMDTFSPKSSTTATDTPSKWQVLSVPSITPAVDPNDDSSDSNDTNSQSEGEEGEGSTRWSKPPAAPFSTPLRSTTPNRGQHMGHKWKPPPNFTVKLCEPVPEVYSFSSSVSMAQPDLPLASFSSPSPSRSLPGNRLRAVGRSHTATMTSPTSKGTPKVTKMKGKQRSSRKSEDRMALFPLLRDATVAYESSLRAKQRYSKGFIFEDSMFFQLQAPYYTKVKHRRRGRGKSPKVSKRACTPMGRVVMTFFQSESFMEEAHFNATF